MPIASSGAQAGVTGRYAQYRAVLGSSNDLLTPRLDDVTLHCAFVSPDADGDGLLNIYESGTGSFASPTDTGSDPLDADSDDDGWNDGAEIGAGTDPNDAQSFPDAAVPSASAPWLAGLTLALLAGGAAALVRIRRRAS